jgi:pantothenate kinase
MRLTSIDQLAGMVHGILTHRVRALVGIAGSPGAGKSTVGAALVDALGPSAVLLPMDGFHLPQAELVRLGRRERMGAPDTFDIDGFVRTLEAVGAVGAASRKPGSGVAVLAPGFDRVIEEAVPDAIAIPPDVSAVVVEGNYLLVDGTAPGTEGWGRVAELLDLTVFVEVDHDVRVERLIARHIAFGKSPEEARAWSLGPDEANARLIEASAGRAEHTLRLR